MIGAKLWVVSQDMGAGCSSVEAITKPFARDTIIYILSLIYHMFMDTAPNCLLPTELRLFLERCDNELERFLQYGGSYEKFMSHEDVDAIDSFVDFIIRALLAFWQEAWSELINFENQAMMTTHNGSIVSDIDFRQNVRRDEAGKINSPLLKSFYENTYARVVIEEKPQDELYTDGIFDDSKDVWEPDLVYNARHNKDVTAKDELKILFFRNFERFAYEEYKKSLIRLKLLDDETEESNLSCENEIDDIDIDSNNKKDSSVNDENKTYRRIDKLIMYIIGDGLRKTIGMMVPKKDASEDINTMNKIAIQQITDHMIISMENAVALNLPIDLIKERGHNGGTHLICVCEDILDLFIKLEDDILTPMLTKIR
jgi:hypothetical protein